MSNYVNQVFLLGTLGRDPEFRTTVGGTNIATFSLATSESRKDAQGNWLEDTTWHNIKAFGRSAETARDQLKKGGKVFVEGKITQESWDDKQTGQKRSKTVVVANYLSVVPTARSSSPVPNQTPAADRERANQSPEITDDDIPF